MIINAKEYQINKFFEADLIDLKNHPNEQIKQIFEIKRKYSVFDFSKIVSDTTKSELKFILVACLQVQVRSAATLIDHYLIPLHHLIDYIVDNGNTITSFKDITDDEFNKYRTSKGINVNRNTENYISRIYFMYRLEKERDYELKDKSIIVCSQLNLSKRRLNHTTGSPSMDFKTIHNDINSQMLKLYIVYCIGCTPNAYDSIQRTFGELRAFLNYLGDKTLDKISIHDIEDYINYLRTLNNSISHDNTCVNHISTFLDYLSLKEQIPSTFNLKPYLIKSDYQYKENRVEQEVILHIFKILHKLEMKYQLMFLIIFTTGMRVSEVCELEPSCLYSTNIDGEMCYMIRFKSEKMHDKSCMNIIPKSLYFMIKKYIKKEKINGKYLFTSIKLPNKPFQSRTFIRYIRKFFNNEGVKNSDGTLYQYKPHSYRHELASTLDDNGTPLYIISDVIHHKSMEMTLAYAEISKKHKRKKYIEYITVHGELDTIIKDDCIGKDAEKLSNGLCVHPLHNCNKINKCLECEYFRTDVSHLERFKVYKKDLEDALIYYNANGFANQAATANKTIASLVKIIEALEKNQIKED